MKYTLLEMVQLILSSMDSEEVNSISDTVEANQVALVIKSVFYDMVGDIVLPELKTLIQLEASGNNAIPCMMTVPTDVIKIETIMYNQKLTAETYPNYQPVYFKAFEDFLADQQSLREETTGVGEQTITLNGETYKIMYRNDRMPTYYTCVDDLTLIFDSYDSTEDTTLQKSKTMCQGTVVPTFTLSDAFTPSLDPTQFAYLINRAKVRAFKELKQVDNNDAGGEARRQKIIVQKRKRKTPDAPPEVYRVTSRFGRK